MPQTNMWNNGNTYARHPDERLPEANVIRIMRRALPPDADISDEAVRAVTECALEYINILTSDANEGCLNEQRRTLHADDVILSVERLGFSEYIEPLTLYLTRYREAQGKRNPVAGESFVRQRTREYQPAAFPMVVQPPPRGAQATFPMVQPRRANGGYYSRENCGGGSSSSGQARLYLRRNGNEANM